MANCLNSSELGGWGMTPDLYIRPTWLGCLLIATKLTQHPPWIAGPRPTVVSGAGIGMQPPPSWSHQSVTNLTAHWDCEFRTIALVITRARPGPARPGWSLEMRKDS